MVLIRCGRMEEDRQREREREIGVNDGQEEE